MHMLHFAADCCHHLYTLTSLHWIWVCFWYATGGNVHVPGQLLPTNLDHTLPVLPLLHHIYSDPPRSGDVHRSPSMTETVNKQLTQVGYMYPIGYMYPSASGCRSYKSWQHDRRYFEQAEAHDLDRARHAEGAVGKYNYCMTLSLRGKKA
jgi:hypothetical protein